MWEYGKEVGALLVFAEHRYYGKSILNVRTPDGKEDLSFLTSEQALADYADLIGALKRRLGAEASRVITFGGSYGGMLSAWFRIKYPWVVDGALAGSAPILAYYGTGYDEESFGKKVTYDATPKAGAASTCAGNIRRAWREIQGLGASADGRDVIASKFRLCNDAPLGGMDDITQLMYWAQSAFDYMAMGNYPYPSSYLTNGVGVLPTFPMRVACDRAAGEGVEGADLVAGLAEAVSVFYNATGDKHCYDYHADVNPETRRVNELWVSSFPCAPATRCYPLPLTLSHSNILYFD